MKQNLTVVTLPGDQGEAYYVKDKLVSVVHSNDAQWRDEYLDPIMNKLGIKVTRKYTPDLSVKQKQELTKKFDVEFLSEGE